MTTLTNIIKNQFDLDLCFAQLYDLAFSWDIQNESNSIETLITISGCSEVNNFIDLGCGTGRFAKEFLRKFKSGIFLDESLEMLNFTKDKCENLGDYKIVQSEIKDFTSIKLFDVAFLMTDTLSYIFPYEKLINSLHAIYNLLKEDGLLIFDIALDKDSFKTEQWTVNHEEFQITTHYKSEDILIDKKLIRSESLTFYYQSTDHSKMLNQSKLLNTFNHEQLYALLVSLGFKYCGAVEPGKTELIDTTDTHKYKRLMYCFKKSS